MSIDAYRAAGQAIAAVLNGLPFARVDHDGIEMTNNGPHTRAAMLGEIAIGLGGIAAVERFQFGSLGDAADFVLSWDFSCQQLADFEMVRGLVAVVDPRDSRDVLFLAWRQACDLVDDDIAWAAVEAMAAAIADGPLDERDALDIMAATFCAKWQQPALG